MDNERRKIHIPNTRYIFILNIHVMDIIRIINDIYFPYVFDCHDSEDEDEYSDKIKCYIHTEVNFIVLTINDNKKIIYCNYQEIIFYISRIIQNVTSTIEPWNLLHGCSLYINNKTYVLLGRSGTGKTTLAAYLMNELQAKLISEDMLIVNYIDNKILPFTRSLLLREDSLSILSNILSRSDITNNKYGIYERYIYQPQISQIMNNEQNIDYYIFIKRDNSKKLTYTPIRDNKLEMFLNSCFLPNNVLINVKGSLIISKRDAYHLTYPDLNSIKEFIKGF